MIAAFTRLENGVQYDYVLTSANETNGVLSGTRTETRLSNGIVTGPIAWQYALLSCVMPCVAGPAGFHRGVVAGEKVNPFQTCQNGCIVMVSPRLDLGVSVTTGTPVQTYATFELTRTVNTCNGDNGSYPSLPSEGTTPTAPTPEAECPAGQRRVYFASGVPSCQPIPVDRFCPTGYTYGTINGKDTCISQGTNPPTASSPTTTDKTATTETKETSTTVENPDGTTTTTTKTSNGKGGGTETVTTKSADGKTIESTTKKTGDDPEGKCVEGTLGCMKPGTPSGDGPVKSDRTVVLGTGVGLSGFSAECPADKVYQTSVAEIRLSYSRACELAPWIKPLVLLAAAVIAGYIVIETLRS